MTKRIFVTATNTNVGKTYTTKLILKEFALRGLKVGVIKPIETGVIDGYAVDAYELFEVVSKLNKNFINLDIKDIVPITYESASAPFVASNNEPLDLEKINTAIKKLENICDILIIEGAGGLLVPIYDEYMMVDLIKDLDATALLVTHCSLGCINDTLLSKKVLQDENISHAVVFNCKKSDDDFEAISMPYFIDSGFSVFKTSKNIDTLCDVLYNL